VLIAVIHRQFNTANYIAANAYFMQDKAHARATLQCGWHHGPFYRHCCAPQARTGKTILQEYYPFACVSIFIS
jgi:hypothetical protein